MKIHAATAAYGVKDTGKRHGWTSLIPCGSHLVTFGSVASIATQDSSYIPVPVCLIQSLFYVMTSAMFSTNIILCRVESFPQTVKLCS